MDLIFHISLMSADTSIPFDPIAQSQGDPLTVGLNAAADLPTQMPPSEMGAAFAKMLLSLLILIALLYLSYWVLRRLIQNRLQRGNENQVIQILEKRVLSPKTMLYLIEVEGKKVLVAESHLEIKSLEPH